MPALLETSSMTIFTYYFVRLDLSNLKLITLRYGILIITNAVLSDESFEKK